VSYQVVATRDAESVRLIVEVSRSGFPPELVGRAFEPFAGGGSERADGRTGAGLGLAIVRAVAEAHGGHAKAANRLEGGARVTVVLRDRDNEALISHSSWSQSTSVIVGREDDERR